MPGSQLHEVLRNLHHELSQLDGGIDETTRTDLEAVLADCRRLLADEAAADAATDDLLRDQVARFEAEHPHLSRLLTQLADGLQNLGI